MLLHTRRLLLRPLARSDAASYHAILGEPDVRRYLLDDQIVSREWVDAEIDRGLALFPSNGCGTWALTLREAS